MYWTRPSECLGAPQAYASVEHAAPWLRLLVWCRAQRHGFASVSVPLCFAPLLAAQFRTQGFTVRETCSLTREYVVLNVWFPPALETAS